MARYDVHCDGSCRRNPGGDGGWGIVVEKDGELLLEGSGMEVATTNNRMELRAAIEALKAVSPAPGDEVFLVSDSTYVVKGLNEWRKNWIASGWRVANADLWRELSDLADSRRATCVWIRGHAGHPQNERCDQLAGEAYGR